MDACPANGDRECDEDTGQPNPMIVLTLTLLQDYHILTASTVCSTTTSHTFLSFFRPII